MTYNPDQDESYQEYLRIKQLKTTVNKTMNVSTSSPPPKTESPNREYSPEKTVWDKTKQQGEIFSTLQRSYEGKGGKWYNGQVRLVIKEFKNNQFVAIENWKPNVKDLKLEPGSQSHTWKGGVNIRTNELRSLANALNALADSL